MTMDPILVEYVGPGVVSFIAGASGSWGFFLKVIVPFYEKRESQLEQLHASVVAQSIAEREICDKKIGELRSIIQKEREEERNANRARIEALEAKLAESGRPSPQ